jgi:GAF domain-containing protein
MAATLDHDVADLKRQLDEARAERDEAEARQAAMAEILEIINSSPGDLAPVFDAMLEKATRLCDAEFGTLWTYDGKRLHPAGLYRVPAGFAEFLREPIGADESAVYAAIVGGQGFVHVPDLADSDAYREGQPLRRATVDLGGARTGLAVAIRKDKTLLGIFAVYRQEVRPFSHKQIALLQNFATQAVVAMGNARLLTETREALEQQTAAAEVLQVTNSSPGDLMPIFEAMVHKAIRLCDAASGTLWTYDGQRFAPAAVSGASRLAELFEQHDPSRASPDTPGGQLLAGERVVHILDVKEDPAYRAHPRFREMADIENCRTFVAVGLRKENVLLGMITVYREEVRPFSGKQIGLLQNFAEQAVIAIENARLINETREAL